MKKRVNAAIFFATMDRFDGAGFVNCGTVTLK